MQTIHKLSNLIFSEKITMSSAAVVSSNFKGLQKGYPNAFTS